MNLRKHPQLPTGIVLGIGALVASVLCVQCVRTYLYADSVLVPQQAEREAERQVGALTTAARSASILDAAALGPVVQHVLEDASGRLQWIRIFDPDAKVVVQKGHVHGEAKIPSGWWQRVEKHENLTTLVNTPEGKAFIAFLPFRLPRPPHPPELRLPGPPDSLDRQPGGRRPPIYLVQVAIPLTVVTAAFEGLRQNLFVGILASLGLLISVLVIGLRAPAYLRGKYLDSQLQLARRVQSDLRPEPHSLLPHVDFFGSALAADHIGGDFYDIFEAEPGKISIVLGDVSGKGVPAAILVSVLQGAIRSAAASHHERACQRINRMLCERSACERFATLFWGVFDTATNTLRYVNAGHAAPMLVRYGARGMERLQEGGAVLGLLPTASYVAGTVKIDASDTLVLYSDGINEAANQQDEEFGEDRMQGLILERVKDTPSALCSHIMNAVSLFAGAGAPSDDRTLLVVRFPPAQTTRLTGKPEEVTVEALA